MKNLLHLSDLHYSPERSDTVRAILRQAVSQQPDHIVITGDLVNSGSIEEMTALGDLLREVGLTSGDQLTVIPGNHDIFGFIYQLFDHPDGVLSGIHSLSGLMEAAGRLWRFRRQLKAYAAADYLVDLERFTSAFAPYFSNVITLPGGPAYPFIKLLGNDSTIIGIDSNPCMPKVYGFINLLISGRQVARTHDITRLGHNLSGSTGWVNVQALDAILAHPALSHRRKIVAMHHCLYDLNDLIGRESQAYAMEMRLVNRDQVAQCLQRHQVDAVLHGHLHTMEAYQADGTLRVLNGGGTFHGDMQQLEWNHGELQVYSIAPDWTFAAPRIPKSHATLTTGPLDVGEYLPA
jgi:predicted phosphodiesterase